MSSDRQTEVIRAQLVSKAVLSPDEMELFTLTQLAGITVDQEVFKIILDLLKLNVPPAKIMQTLKSMCSTRKPSTSNTEASTQDSSSLLFVSGVSKTSHRHGDSSHSRVDLTLQSDQSGRSESQERSSSLVQTSSRYGQDGSGYSVSSLSRLDRDGSNTSSQTRFTSDSSFGRNELRSQDHIRENQRSAMRADSYITARQTNNSSDYDSYHKEKAKKRTS
ncbi:unnamed protein product [Candidula unifasciata]|uniref:Uncharacterized protein n=1 Tax=Candidula unifasciata TaxID=100452 RepID=A0A8S3ZB14_9EUPU|nr:unnamed protein product [Candidula unifasciata]